ncbi:MAG: pteridine reductase [Gammaproteobacteria bacterium]|nr:pteridine reductase [Gammaproteobacteria bacterium]
MNELPVVLITGSAKRIGASIAKKFHRQGFRVVLHCHHSADDADALAQQLNAQEPGSAALVKAALNDMEAVEQLADLSLKCFGRVDVLINNASSFYPTALDEVSQQHWDELIGSNLRGAFFLSSTLANELTQRRGNIVNIIDVHADRPLARHPVYNIAKAGLKAMTRSLALELAPHVRVNGVSPGAILWPTALADDTDPVILQKREAVLKQVPLGRTGSVEEIAATVYFLVREASYLTGAVIKVDGGRSLSW